MRKKLNVKVVYFGTALAALVAGVVFLGARAGTVRASAASSGPAGGQQQFPQTAVQAGAITGQQEIILAPQYDAEIKNQRKEAFKGGRQTFRFDTFGDQSFWGATLHLNQAIEGARFGGVGPGLSPSAALALGLKVDVNALPPAVIQKLKSGTINLNDPAVTLALLRLNAVVGVTGFFDGQGALQSVGIQCALCHSTVDNSLTYGIGGRLDGWPNQDLNVGAIIALAPNLQPLADLLGVDQATVREVLRSWGPGKFDAELDLDGKAFQPNGRSSATVIPPAFRLAGVNLHTYEGWGSIPYWNAFVAVLEMHGQGNFFDSRLDDASQFPIAARNGFGHIHNDPDLVTPALGDLHYYQLSLPAPTPPKGSFDPVAAAQGSKLFNGRAQCSTCHMPPTYTDSGWNMHTGEEVCEDNFQADRAPDDRYRTSPLNGLWAHQERGFYHDGRFATLLDVVQHYNACLNLGLSDQDENNIVQFLKSLPAAPPAPGQE
jgi:hypothetical protein